LVPDGPPLRNRGQQKLSIDFNGMPRGTKTAHKGDDGLFKEVKLNRGRSMALASQDA
jgi:hypothetical protein